MKGKMSAAQRARKILLLLLMVALVAIEISFNLSDDDSWTVQMLYMCSTRLIGGAVCAIFMIEFSFDKIMNPLGNKSCIALLAVIPAFVVAVNNFPFVSFFAGDCGLDASIEQIFLYALFCLSVGIFEEMAFRGCVLMYLLKSRKDSRKGIFMAIFWSSVVFGLIHLINLFTSSPLAVLLQIGYSALIGALCSLVLLATKNIWLCVLLHATYNFVGNVVSELGNGEMWTLPQMIFTAAVAVAVTAYCVWLFFKLPVSRAKELYGNN